MTKKRYKTIIKLKLKFKENKLSWITKQKGY